MPGAHAAIRSRDMHGDGDRICPNTTSNPIVIPRCTQLQNANSAAAGQRVHIARQGSIGFEGK